MWARTTLGTNHADAISIKTGISTMHESNKEKPLGVIFDNKFTFEEHISCVERLAVKYLHFLASVIYQLKANYGFNESICKLPFNMKHPMTWMLHSRKLNNNINKLHERALRITYRDQNSSFQSLLEKDTLQLIAHIMS